MGGGGVPPFLLNFLLLKIGLKTVIFGQKMLFLAENLLNFVRYELRTLQLTTSLDNKLD